MTTAEAMVYAAAFARAFDEYSGHFGPLLATDKAARDALLCVHAFRGYAPQTAEVAVLFNEFRAFGSKPEESR